MKKFILLALISATCLTGCARAKQELGLTRRTPDEFAVVKRAPLEIPPDLNSVTTLPAPRPGMQRPQETSPELTAQTAILGTSAPASKNASTGESALLKKAGASDAVTNIRAQVDREATENADKNRPVAKKLMNMVKKPDENPASVVDAPAEAKRLKQNTQGETPSIDQ